MELQVRSGIRSGTNAAGDSGWTKDEGDGKGGSKERGDENRETHLLNCRCFFMASTMTNHQGNGKPVVYKASSLSQSSKDGQQDVILRETNRTFRWKSNYQLGIEFYRVPVEFLHIEAPLQWKLEPTGTDWNWMNYLKEHLSLLHSYLYCRGLGIQRDQGSFSSVLT